MRCYNCEEFGHFANECKNEKKPRVCEEAANVTAEESNLFMAFTKDVLLQGVQEMTLQDGVWYLDTGASSHITSKRSFFHSIDENQHGVVRFGDESSVAFKGRGSIFLNYPSEEELKLEGVLYVLILKVNIMSQEKLDDDSLTSTLGGYLSIFDNEGMQFANIQNIDGSMYLLKMYVFEFCQLIREEENEVWMWLCHQNFRAIDDMRRGEMVSGLPKFFFSDHLCKSCVAKKHIRSAFSSASEF